MEVRGCLRAASYRAAHERDGMRGANHSNSSAIATVQRGFATLQTARSRVAA